MIPANQYKLSFFLILQCIPPRLLPPDLNLGLRFVQDDAINIALSPKDGFIPNPTSIDRQGGTRETR